MGIIIEVVFLFALLKYLFGSETAGRWAGSCITDVITVVIAVVGYFLVDTFSPSLFPILAYILGGVIVLCIIWIIYNLLCAAFKWNN